MMQSEHWTLCIVTILTGYVLIIISGKIKHATFLSRQLLLIHLRVQRIFPKNKRTKTSRFKCHWSTAQFILLENG